MHTMCHCHLRTTQINLKKKHPAKVSYDDVNYVEMQVTDDTVVTYLTKPKMLYARMVASDFTVKESCSSDSRHFYLP